MPVFTRDIIVIVKDDEIASVLTEWYNMEDVEQDYGGNMPNVSAPFFPPKMAGKGHTMLTKAEVKKYLKKGKENANHEEL
jgi:hypothetical protein